jgi:hypothetical protein
MRRGRPASPFAPIFTTMRQELVDGEARSSGKQTCADGLRTSDGLSLGQDADAIVILQLDHDATTLLKAHGFPKTSRKTEPARF